MTSTDYSLGYKTSSLIYLLFVFATLSMLNSGAFSTSLIFGALLLILSFKNFRFFLVPRGISMLLLIFILICYISLLTTVVPFGEQHKIRIIQVFYWFLLAIFIFNSYDYIDKEKLSKVVFLTVLIYLLINLRYRLVLRNEVAFTVIIMGPLGFLFSPKYIFRMLYALAIVTLMIFLGSRAGAIICFSQIILFFILFAPKLNRHAKHLTILLMIIAFSVNLTPVRNTLGRFITPMNERVGSFLLNPGEVYLNDISWLQRRAQIQKGFQIFKEHPLLGIGIFNFQEYKVDIDISGINNSRGTIRNINSRSSHNVYISLLSETGILGLSVVVVMFLLILLNLFVNFNKIAGTFEAAVFISLIGMLVYFYFISSFFGTSSWLLYGLCLGASDHVSRARKLEIS